VDKKEKGILIGLFVLAGVLGVFLVREYDGLLKIRQTGDPFIQDRVVPVKIVMAEKDWQWILANPMAEQYVRADFWFDGRKYPNVAVRPKGNSSLMSVAGSGSKRMSLKIDFNFFNSAQTFCGLKKLCLNNGFSDPTYIREILGYELFKGMNIPTPRASFVDLYINNLHLGLYTQVEPIDKTFLRRHFSNPNGNLYKPEIGAATLNWTEADVEKNKETNAAPLPPQDNSALAIRIGGSRLGDLLRLLGRENGQDQTAALPGGPFAQGPFPGGFGPGGPPFFPGGPGGFRPDPNQFPFPPPGGFMPDPNQFPFPPPGMNQRPPEGFARGGGPFGGFFPAPRPGDPNGFGRAGDRMAFGPGGRGPRFGGPGGFGFGRGNLLENMGLKTNENYANHTALFRFLEVLNHCPDDSFPSEIEKVLDVDQVLRFLAVSVLIVHLDNYIGMGHNYYLYETDGQFTILPWDLNMGFGTFRMGAFQQDITEFFIDEPVTGSMDDRPLVKRLFAYKPYLDRYHQYLEELLAGGFAEGAIESRIDRWISLIRPYVEKDELKFFTMEDFDKGLTEGSSGMGWMRPPGGMNTPNTPPAGGMGPSAQAGGQRDQNRPMRAGGFGGFGGFGRPGGGRGPGGPGGPGGMGAPGLKSFIAKRRVSVRRQLDGDLPSRPTEEQRQQMNQRFPGMPGMPPGPGGMR
jgi:hypothetical protein